MTAAKIRPGDVVILNSGGPRMTVVAIEGENVCCARTDERDGLEQAWFPAVCVYPVSGPAGVGVG